MGYGADDATIMRAEWPTAKDTTLRGMAEPYVAFVDQKHDLIRLGRNLRADYEVPPGKKVDFAIRPVSPEAEKSLRSDERSIATMLRAEKLTIDAAFQPAKAAPSAISALGTIYLSLEGLIDAAAEVTKLSGQLDKINEELVRVAQKLDNPNFVQKAKPEVVELQQAKRQELTEKRDKIQKLIEALSSQTA
jgi:valyl-tRNA synthetase